ncbi:MAG: trigger factor [Omnitrophica bacterium RIFCSPLOWO2_12_FULL_45_13]|nr:MAG: trigger factor [Omnitrophica bacterium RIFCSPLOWO2_12_FULL_45_13]
MKTKAKSVEECTTLFEIEVPKETIDKAFEDMYAQFAKSANIPGFRVGKAPKELVRKYYPKEAKKEVMNQVIPGAYQNAVEEHKIEPIGYPEITDLIFEEGKMMTFKAKVDTRPKFKLKNYKGIQIDKKKAAVKGEDINKAIENLREYNAKYVAAEDRPIQLNDYVVSDLECVVDGRSAHKKRENLWLYADKESLMSGLTEKMIGMKKGEERDIEVALPEKYPDKTLAGKIAKYHVNVKDIKVRSLPSVDDEFAKDLGKENLEQLKKEIAEALEKKMVSDGEIAMENQLLSKLIDENSFAVPSNLIKKQAHLMIEDAKAKLQEKGFKKEDLDKKDDEFTGRFKDDAARRVRLMFILDRIATDETIEADDKDLENAYKAISIQTGKNEKEIKDYYEKEALKDNLLERIREEKTIEFLLKNADIKEKD